MTEANEKEDVESESKVVGPLDSCGALVRGEGCAGDGATDPVASCLECAGGDGCTGKLDIGAESVCAVARASGFFSRLYKSL